METPSISIRVTRSQSSSLKNSIPPITGKKEENGVSRSRKGRADRSVLIDITNDSPIGGLAVGRLETPASSKRLITGKKEENGVSRSRKGRADRSVLIDITNDSPIGGLAVGRLETPASSKIKIISCANIPKTPCSGEVLLRCQVKSLLQKVEEEEAENLKLSSEKLPFGPLRTLLNSPATLLAPTPANTPVIGTPDMLHSTSSSANLIKEDQETVKILEVIANTESYKSEESPISRTLLFVDSPGKTEMPDDSSMVSSTITFEDDDSSEWSVEVNASSPKDGHEEDEEEEYQERGAGLIDELCEEFQAICVEEKQGLLEFTGKHTRFIYNSDDEIEGEEDVANSPGVMRLKGIPTPKGRHVRFPDEDGEN